MKKILLRKIDLNRWRYTGDRVLVYGRRKVGKSFFVKNFTNWRLYFYVKRDGGILDVENGREVSYEYLKDILLSGKERVVIDEFHRLPEDFLDFLQVFADRLNLVLITSTLWLAERIFEKDSPLLGLFQRFKMGLIDERDIILGLSDVFSGRDLVEASVYLREPWLIPMVNGTVKEWIPRIMFEEKDTVERLIGEIFREEDRRLKKSYVAILSLVSDGKMRSGEISTHLYARKIIPRDDPSIIQGYLRTLVNIGLLERVRIHNRKFDHYVHVSPITDFYFYLDSKYGFSELEAPIETIKKAFSELLPRHVEQYMRGLLSKIYGLYPAKIVERDFDVDIVLLDFQKIRVVAEVKWKKSLTSKEIKKTIDVLSRFNGAKKILIIPDEQALPRVDTKDIYVWDPKKILDETRKSLEKLGR